MGSSYAQIIVGGGLLVTAFLFGKYINDKPVGWGAKTNIALTETGSLNLQATDQIQTDSSTAGQSDSNSLQRSLRDRILGERKENKLRLIESEAAEQHPRNDQLPEPKPFVARQAVVPDFSHMNSLEKLPLPKPPVNEDVLAKPLKAKSNREVVANDGIVIGPIPTGSISDTPGTANKATLSANRPADLSQVSPRDIVVRRAVFTNRKPQDAMVPVRRLQRSPNTDSEEFISYKTVFGDTLHNLSSRFFGKPDYYLDIYKANKELFENPAKVPVNTTLRIPIKAELIRRK